MSDVVDSDGIPQTSPTSAPLHISEADQSQAGPSAPSDPVGDTPPVSMLAEHTPTTGGEVGLVQKTLTPLQQIAKIQEVNLNPEYSPTHKRLLPPKMYASRRPRIRLDELTIDMLETFLTELGKTHQWNLSAARAGVRPEHMRELCKMDEEFRAMCEDSKATYIETIASEAARRAFEGWDEEVYSQKTGMQIGTVKKFDGKLAELILKRYDPAYRERFEGTITHTGGVIVVPQVPKTSQSWEDAYRNDPPQAKQIEATVIDPPKALDTNR